MNLLNEIAQHHPGAVSFAAGRPYEGFFALEDVHRYLDTFCEHLAADRGLSDEEVRRTLFQYGRTNGVINDLVAAHLAVDEGIDADPESIVVTVGCQEAMFLVLRALRRDERDVALAISPTYVGFGGAAQLADMRVLPVRSGPEGIDLADLAAVAGFARHAGFRPRACYLIPDFANPLGVSLSLQQRRRLLEAAAELDILLLEDNPYGLFPAAGERLPTLKSLDTGRRVVYFGSFAKTVLPGARVGYVVADQPVLGPDCRLGVLADELSKIKSMLTVNTSPVAQAVVAGRLLEHGGSLVAANVRESALYARNLGLVLDGLARRFPAEARTGVSWNAPDGGFFVVVTVPFATTDALLEESARRYGVLWTPMHHFYTSREATCQLRLAGSLLEPEQIDEGLDRLAAFIRAQ
ncbi:MAG: PLP-dependent aminotransferase family protein [Catenulispora sp.]|nr:PLP-dependent aminotransferase family protein [Catenulispora sp.]